MFEEIVTHYPDFPKPGIDFIDVLPFLQDRQVFQKVVHELNQRCTAPNIATVEARGFLFASPMLVEGDRVQTIVPLRKKGKLPYTEGDLVRVSIEKEYGSDEVYYRRSDLKACKVTGDVVELTLLDDLLATGGTAFGIAQALQNETVGGRRVVIKEFLFLVELPALGGRALLESIAPVKSLLSLDGVE